MIAFQNVIEEARREQLIGLPLNPDPGPLSRTLLRLRHDLVILGRAAATPLPDALGERLGAKLSAIAAVSGEWLRAGGAGLAARMPPPDNAGFEAALDEFAAEFASLRREGAIRPLSGSEAEQLFALSFGLEQLRQNFRDLARCIADWAQTRGR